MQDFLNRHGGVQAPGHLLATRTDILSTICDSKLLRVAHRAGSLTQLKDTIWGLGKHPIIYAREALLEAIIATCAFALALDLRFDGQVPSLPHGLLVSILTPVPVMVVICLCYGIYSRTTRYAGVYDALAVLQAMGASSVVVLFADAFWPGQRPLPFSVVAIAGILAFLGTTLVKFRQRIAHALLEDPTECSGSRLLVIGAGQAGQRLARELLAARSLDYQPLGFVDDDVTKQGQRIHGLPVIGTRHDLAHLIEQLQVEVVALAIPSLSAEERKAMLVSCLDLPVRIKLVPGLPELLVAQPDDVFRDLRAEDLLDRAPVNFAGSLANEAPIGTVLVTGAAGSIGSELARQVALSSVKRVVLLDTNESGLVDLAAELERSAASASVDVAIELSVTDVAQRSSLARVFDRCEPEVVFHAAAYKHVPVMEFHPREAVRTNVIGTFNVCAEAERANTGRVVFISTDKAVSPVNVMGATKHLGERIMQVFAANANTKFCAVRFGNVLGSRGSVVPIFERQIRQGGPVTVTHPQMRRFFMTIPEAVNLIVEASRQASGGEIFVLDMGQPVSIVDLAQRMIRLHGLRPGADIQIKEIGPRPGEKFDESLSEQGETLLPTAHPRVLRLQPKPQAKLERGDLLGYLWDLAWLVEFGSRDELLASLFGEGGPESRHASRVRDDVTVQTDFAPSFDGTLTASAALGS